MANIKAYFLQYKKMSDQPESELSITVDYNPKSDTVEGIIKVEVYNYDKKISTDITAIMAEQFSGQLDEMIDSINWREEYALRRVVA
jgi:hypothetical protein